MQDTLITHVQLVLIGFTFGIAGPCLLQCAPAIVAYISGTKNKIKDIAGSAAIFLSARLVSYIILGYAAGLSGELLKRITSPGLSHYFRISAGLVSIILGLLVIMLKDSPGHLCSSARSKAYDSGSVFLFGFIVGIMPCAPLGALLLEIALMSKSGFEGALYALSFGLGTFLSGFIVIAAASGIITKIPAYVLKSEKARFAFTVACACFLIILGVSLLI